MFQSSKDILDREAALRSASADGKLDRVKHYVVNNVGLNINSFSTEGEDEKQTALHLACENGHLDVVIFLIEHGANINAKGLGLSTPLHGAAYFGHLDVVKELLNRGADRNAINSDNDRPIDYAELEGNDDVAAYLKERNLCCL